MATSEELIYEISIAQKDLDKQLKGVQKSFDKTFDKIDNSASKATSAGSVFKGMIGAEAVMKGMDMAVDAVSEGIKKIVSETSQLEDATLDWEMLTGSAEEAGVRIKSVYDFANRTPFDTKEVNAAATNLYKVSQGALGAEADLVRLGDAAKKGGVSMVELSTTYGRLHSKFKAGEKSFGDEINRMTDLGLVSFEAKQALQAMDEQLLKTEGIKLLNSELEKAQGTMERFSATISGKMGTLSSTWDQVFAIDDEELKKSIGDSIDTVTKILEDNKPAFQKYMVDIAKSFTDHLSRFFEKIDELSEHIISKAIGSKEGNKHRDMIKKANEEYKKTVSLVKDIFKIRAQIKLLDNDVADNRKAEKLSDEIREYSLQQGNFAISPKFQEYIDKKDIYGIMSEKEKLTKVVGDDHDNKSGFDHLLKHYINPYIEHIQKMIKEEKELIILKKRASVLDPSGGDPDILYADMGGEPIIPKKPEAPKTAVAKAGTTYSGPTGLDYIDKLYPDTGGKPWDEVEQFQENKLYDTSDVMSDFTVYNKQTDEMSLNTAEGIKRQADYNQKVLDSREATDKDMLGGMTTMTNSMATFVTNSDAIFTTWSKNSLKSFGDFGQALSQGGIGVASGIESITGGSLGSLIPGLGLASAGFGIISALGSLYDDRPSTNEIAASNSNNKANIVSSGIDKLTVNANLSIYSTYVDSESFDELFTDEIAPRISELVKNVY